VRVYDVLVITQEVEMASPTTVDEYMAGLDEDRRATLEQIRAAVKQVAPEATEAISYKMPAFKLNGRFLVSYDAFKRHSSLFPASDAVCEELGDEIAPYLSGKGTIRFPSTEPVPVDLVRRVVEIRLREEAARG